MQEPTDSGAPEAPPPDFKRAFVALMQQTQDAASDAHLSDDELIAYHAGALPAAEKERLQSHLEDCRRCFALAADLEAFAAAESAPSPPAADFETAASWRALRLRLNGERGAPTRRWHVPAAVAATFLVTALGFSFWSAPRQPPLAPQPNVGIYDLVADTSERSGGATEPQPVASDTDSVLILTPDIVREYSGYRVQILAGDSLVWTDSVEKNLADETFTVGLPAGFLASGEYRLELHGLGEDGGSEVIARYPLRLTTSEVPPP